MNDDTKRTDEAGTKINTIGNVRGDNIRISQVYAPGAGALVPEVFSRSSGAAPFSAEWLLFSQQSVSLIGREEESVAMHRFLDDAAAFAWWAITGSGGSGKSRFALDFLDRLPDDWEGGFLPRGNFSSSDTAAWQPRGNMLWIIDDAAAASNELASIIARWAALHGEGPFKLRLLLLERNYSADAGWWAELTQRLSPQAVLINGSLIDAPLALAPLGTLADAFLAALQEQLDTATATRLAIALAALGEDKISEQTQGGNPLLLMLLAAELLSDTADPDGPVIDKGDLAQRYFARELDLLRLRCEAAQLRFGMMLDLLFLTTSCAPITLLLDQDVLVLHTDEGVFLSKDAEGLHYAPNIGELRSYGFDVDRYVRSSLQDLETVLEIDDVQAYLSVLDEIGLLPRRYAIGPDLISAALFNLIFNSAETPINLKRRRGEFDAARVARLIDGALGLSENSAWAAWARLSDRTLALVPSYVREYGKSIRWPMLVTRELNRRRSSKVPFDPDRIFGPSKVHPDAPDVGRYFADLRATIAHDGVDDAELLALGASPHSWTAPYVDSLLDISGLEQLQLGLALCAISNPVVLDRLTNLENIMVCLQSAVTSVTKRQLSELERLALDQLVDAIFEFAAFSVWPTMTRIDDRSYAGLYKWLARPLITASYLVANRLRGHAETSGSRARALAGLDIARMALAIAPSSGDLEYVDRNAAILRSQDMADPAAAAALYRQTLSAMQAYADAKAYTGAIEDMLHAAHTRPAPQMLDTLLEILGTAPPELVRAERLLDGVQDILVTAAQSGNDADAALAWRLTPSFLRYFSAVLRQTENDDLMVAIRQMFALAANLAHTADRQEEVAQLIVELHASLAKAPPGAVFMHALLGGVQAVQEVFRMRRSPFAAQIPFTTHYSPVDKAELTQLVTNDEERAKLAPILGLTVATLSFSLGDELFVNYGIRVQLAEIDEPDLAAATAFGQDLFTRLQECDPARWHVSERSG
jgi:hypothetical protein